MSDTVPVPSVAPGKKSIKCKVSSHPQLFTAEQCWADPIPAERKIGEQKSAWAQLRRDRPSPSRTVPRCHRIQSRNQFCASVIIQHISILRLRNSLPKAYLFVKLSTRNTLMGWLLGESLSGFVLGAVGYCGWRRSGVGGGASRAERTKLGRAKARQADQQGLGLSGAEPRRAGFG